MSGTSKSIFRKIADSRFATRYLIGEGIDIGSGKDPLWPYMELFPLMRSCRPWDLQDGDAQLMEGVPDASLDFVHSSHCLEHMKDPRAALDNWLRILKPGGHLVCIIPDEDLYEQGIWPSIYNYDHKHTFTVHKKKSWCADSVNVTELLTNTAVETKIMKIELLDAGYRYMLDDIDQTKTPTGECGIEFILKRLWS